MVVIPTQPVDRAISQMRLALQERGISYELPGDDHLVIGYGSAEIGIRVRARGESTVIHIAACVLDEVTIEADQELLLMRGLNERNRTVSYGKFFFENGSIQVEYELLGDFMQDEEFISALTAIAQVADDHDDLLRSELGSGRRAADRTVAGAGDLEA